MMEGHNTDQSANSSSFLAHSPDLFSDDEDAYCDAEYSETSHQVETPRKHKVSHHSQQEEIVVNLETARLHRLCQLLQGVPPPPSKTIPQISVTDILQLWNEYVRKGDLTNTDSEGCSTVSLWKPSVPQEEAVHAKWPDAKYVIFPDLHYNVCGASEDVERLSMKLHERYVGAETSSWCNSILSSMSSSAKKRQRTRGLGHTSPGCRLSHLARRRQTFSSANLAQLSSVAGSGTAGGVPNMSAKGPSAARRLLMTGPSGAHERRRIMVEIKKTDRNKRVKTHNKQIQKCPESAPSVSSSSSGIPQDKPPAQSTKRALFQSPEDQKQAALIPIVTNFSEQNPAQRSKRALWPPDSCVTTNENGKRSLDMGSTTAQQLKLQCLEDRSRHIRTSRSLPYSLGHSSGSNNISIESCSTQVNAQTNKARRASDQGPSSQTISLSGLSELHKRKLYWAISQALRKEGISTKHSDFQPCATLLAHHYIRVRREMIDFVPASTSEHMLQVVSAKVGEVVQTQQASKAGQEENHCIERLPLKEERSNKGLFRDATASLNVRRSLSVSLPSSDQLSVDMKPQQCLRVPSARKSLTFDSIGTKCDSLHNHVESSEYKIPREEKGNDRKHKILGENVPFPSVKRVSRSLFLSPTDDSKAVSKRESAEQSLEDVKQSSCLMSGNVSLKDEGSSGSGSVKTMNAHIELSVHQESELSSVPNSSVVSVTNGNEADNDTSEGCGISFKAEQANQHDGCENFLHGKSSSHVSVTIASTTNVCKNTLNAGLLGDESQMRLQCETKQTVPFLSQAQSSGRVTRKSLSLSRKELRSSSTESGELCGSSISQSVRNNPGCNSVDDSQLCNLIGNCKHSFQHENQVSDPQEICLAVKDDTYVPHQRGVVTSPFPKDIIVTEVSDSNSAPKVQIQQNGEESLQSDSSAVPDLNSEASEINKDSDTALESKVITPLLEGAVIESPGCVGSESSSSVDTTLTFRGRIESLKPLVSVDTTTDLDPNLSFNVSSSILDVDEAEEKGPVLEKWAERASRSNQKVIASSETINTSAVLPRPTSPAEQPSSTIEESMLAWEESQLDAAAQSSTKMFEEFRNIFDSSSQQDSS